MRSSHTTMASVWGATLLAVGTAVAAPAPALAATTSTTSATSTSSVTSAASTSSIGALGTGPGNLAQVLGGVTNLATTLLPGTGRLLGGFVGDGWRYDDHTTTLAQVRASIGADAPTARRYRGSGIGVALLDTGVVDVPALSSGNVVNGPDLSFESQSTSLAHLDTFGHGTHLAALYWVVAHRNDDPRNPIRVVNLSYGTNGVQPSTVDPLDHAVENAWRAGIVVVVSAGNGGQALDNPARDPFVIAVGASDPRGTTAPGDDSIPDFSARGDALRRVDLVAPGTSIASLRDPGSAIDTAYPQAAVGDRLLRGSGTSQAAAVVSGAVAALLSARPQLTPDQVKSVLTRSATSLLLADANGRGAGELDLAAALSALPALAPQRFAASQGTGSLESSRGDAHVYDGSPAAGNDGDQPVALTGENTILGPFSSSAWARASSAGRAWVGGSWMGQPWTGGCACDRTWAGLTWSGAGW